eukprot:scaffold13318_cov80-Skeletonema_dohrnii-CCMP3373.AAC.1
MSARSRSISPSTSIRSRSDSSYDSDCVESGLHPRYAGLSEEELMNIWERRNLAYFDRRQRLLAEERQRQQHQQQQQGGDVNVSGEESTTTDNNEEEEPQAGVPLEIELSEPLSSVQRVDQQEQQIAR